MSNSARQNTTRYFDQHVDYWEAIYGEDNSFTAYRLQKRLDYVIQQIDKTPGSHRILDLGCGAGVTTAKMTGRDRSVFGIDIALGMVQRGKIVAPDAFFQQASVEALPYVDESFDVGVALGLIANLPGALPTLKEMYRVLRPGGFIVMSVANRIALDLLVALPQSLPIMFEGTALRHPIRQLSNVIRSARGRAINPVTTMRSGNPHTAWTMTHLLQRANFRNIQVEALVLGPLQPFGLPIFSDHQLIRISESLSAQRWLQPLGTTMMYTARKSLDSGK